MKALVLVLGLLAVLGVALFTLERVYGAAKVELEERKSEIERPYVCPPCGMKMPADTVLTEIAGKTWAACNARCAEIIEASPDTFAQYAIAE